MFASKIYIKGGKASRTFVLLSMSKHGMIAKVPVRYEDKTIVL